MMGVWRWLPSNLFLVCCLIIISKTVCGEQKFSVEPEDADVILGSTQRFYCKVENLFAHVQWTRDGFGLGAGDQLPGFPRYSIFGNTNDGEFNLMITNSQLEDDAVYQCQVMATESTPPLLSRKAVLTVYVPLSYPTIPGGGAVRVIANTPTNLTCHANGGRPLPNITWTMQGEEFDETLVTGTLRDDGKTLNATGSFLFVPSRADDGKEIACRVQNAAMHEPRWKFSRLEVHYHPQVTMTLLSGGIVKEFANLQFMCEAHGKPNDITWKWYIGDSQIDDEYANILDLTSISRDLHGKEVSCEATNSVGPSRQSYLLKIQYGPRFENAAADYVAADISDSVELTCHVDSNPPASVIWTRHDAVSQTDRPHLILSSSPTYHIDHAMSADFGAYTCTASAIGFDEVRRVIYLLKKGPPRITSADEQFARFGESGTLECASESIPKPTTITWMKDGKVLDWDNLHRYQVVATNSPRGQRSTIHVSQVGKSDLGTYNCSVQNGYGIDFKLIKFRKQASLPIAYVLTGVLIGVFLIIGIAVAIFIYQRRKSRASESSSDSTVSSIAKKPGSGDVPMDYRSGANPVEAWRQDTKYYRYSAEYDELNYPPKERAPSAYDYKDGYGNYGYDYQRDYGTYPGTAAKIYDTRYNPSHAGSFTAGDLYGTYPAPRPDYAAPSDYATRPPVPIDSSRLSTNV